MVNHARNASTEVKYREAPFLVVAWKYPGASNGVTTNARAVSNTPVKNSHAAMFEVITVNLVTTNSQTLQDITQKVGATSHPSLRRGGW